MAEMEAKFPLNAAAIQIDSEIYREPLLTWKAKEPAASHKMDYSVPNFGVDSDIADSEKSMAEMESKFPLKYAAV
jgi:hypothetical protein